MFRRFLYDARFWVVLKLVFAALFAWYLWNRAQSIDWKLWDQLPDVSYTIAVVLVFFLLFAINWLADTWLWWSVVRSKAHIRFREAFRINLISHAVGLVTPANIGEYGIKALHFTEMGKYRESFLLTFSYRSAKTFVKWGLGLTAGAILWWDHPELRWVCLFMVAGLAIGYRFVPHLLTRLYHSRLGRYFFDSKENKSWQFKDRSFYITFLPALIKFTSYTLQLAILLNLRPGFELQDLFWRSSAVYSLSSFIPTLSLFDPMVKTSIGDVVMAPIDMPLGWLAFCTSIVWLVNLGLPSIVGFILWLRMKR